MKLDNVSYEKMTLSYKQHVVHITDRGTGEGQPSLCPALRLLYSRQELAGRDWRPSKYELNQLVRVHQQVQKRGSESRAQDDLEDQACGLGKVQEAEVLEKNVGHPHRPSWQEQQRDLDGRLQQ